MNSIESSTTLHPPLQVQEHIKKCDTCSEKFEFIKANKAAMKILGMMVEIKLYRNEIQSIVNCMPRGLCMNHWDIHATHLVLEKSEPMKKQLRYQEDAMNKQIIAYSHEEFSEADSKNCQFIAQHTIPYIPH